MILLDSDHLSVLEIPDNPRRSRLVARLALSGDDAIGTTIVNVEEQMRGWLASIAKERQPLRQVRSYTRLAGLFAFFHQFHLALFDEESAARFATFAGIQIGTMDRKIAAIALASKALLLTANRRDFDRIPGLHFENWIDEPPAPTNPGSTNNP